MAARRLARLFLCDVTRSDFPSHLYKFPRCYTYLSLRHTSFAILWDQLTPSKELTEWRLAWKIGQSGPNYVMARRDMEQSHREGHRVIGNVECSEGRQTSCVDVRYWLGMLRRRTCRRLLSVCEGHVRTPLFSYLASLTLQLRVKLLSGSLSHQNPGNQFGHLAPIFTIILLSITAVLQIICLNRGLKVYDSTLVVPVLYGVYTATG